MTFSVTVTTQCQADLAGVPSSQLLDDAITAWALLALNDTAPTDFAALVRADTLYMSPESDPAQYAQSDAERTLPLLQDVPRAALLALRELVDLRLAVLAEMPPPPFSVEEEVQHERRAVPGFL